MVKRKGGCDCMKKKRSSAKKTTKKLPNKRK